MIRPAFAILALAVSIAQPAAAWFRVPCTTPIVQERVDPIINFGQSPTNHVHTVHGGNNFASTATFDTLRKSACTDCQVSQDLSNYWFPKLYFKDPTTGQFEAVPNGGLLVYYENRGNGDPSNGGPGLKAFPAGLKMISGSPTRRARHYPLLDRSSQAALREAAVQWACIGGDGPAGYDWTSGGGFPHSNCPGGFRHDLHMPACWDGKNLDSANHMDHVAYLSDLDNGVCPSTHPVPFIAMFYEITWDVNSFASRWDGKNWPFVLATGDPTGYSWHGDFLNGWDVTALQNAIDKCNSTPDQLAGKTEACSYLTVIPASTANQCKGTLQVSENITGPFARLPGCNPLQSGPGDATLYSTSNCPI